MPPVRTRSNLRLQRPFTSYENLESGDITSPRAILATFSFSINFLALGSFVVGILALLGVLQGYQNCTMAASPSHPETKGACLMLSNNVEVCEEWTCYAFSISLIVIACMLWVIQIGPISVLMDNGWGLWIGKILIASVMILVLVAASFMVINENNAEKDTTTPSDSRVGNLGGLAFLWFGLALLFLISHKRMA